MPIIRNSGNDFILIPAPVRHCLDIPPMAKLIYGEMGRYMNGKGYFIQSNSELGVLYGISGDRVSRLISILKKKGFIDTEIIYVENTKEVLERRIYLKY